MEIRQSRGHWGTWLVILAGVVVGMRISGSASGDLRAALTGPIRVVVLMLPAAVVLTSLHETAHAVVGRLVGWRVYGVTIGQGRRHATVRVGSVSVELRGVLIGGVTIARPTGRRGRDASMLIAGVALEGVVIALALAWAPESTWAHSARWALVVVACIDIAANLWPHRVDVGSMTGMATDGAQLLSVITTPDQWRHDLEQMQWTEARAELVQSLHGGDIERALELARAELAIVPSDETARHLHATLLLLADRWREAYDALAPLADTATAAATVTDTNKPEVDPLLLNNAAWAAVMTFEPSLLPHADRLSEQALAARPTEPACSNTRGATLVLLGRADEGLRLLERAASGRLSRKQKAYVLAFTALAEHRLGRHGAVGRHLSRSEQLDGECPALPEVKRLLAQPAAPVAPPAALAAWPQRPPED